MRVSQGGVGAVSVTALPCVVFTLAGGGYNEPHAREVYVDVVQYEIEGVKLIKPRLFGDARGFFMESYNRQKYAEIGLDQEFVQDNHSKSSRNTLRGLHYQVNRWQGKLVRCVRGRILDVAVDIRANSPTYGQWVAEELNDENHWQLWVPEGFAHGFSVLSDAAEVLYKVTDYWSPGDERGIIWNDPDLAIDWRLDGDPLLSEKDLANPRFRDLKHQ